MKLDLKKVIFILVLVLIFGISRESIQYKKIKAAKQKAFEESEKIYLTGKFDPAFRDDFVLVSSQNTLMTHDIYLRKEAYGAFLLMQQAAARDNVDLKIASATRNFDYQKKFWERQWTGYTLVGGQDLSATMPNEGTRFQKILEYNAVPGTSRHHWGTDIDVNGANVAYFTSGNGKREYEWLKNNASSFGFCQTYIEKGLDRPYGYSEEKWHWSYLPLARNLTQEYKNLVKVEDIKGFLGDQYVPEDLISDYVLGINPDCI